MTQTQLAPVFMGRYTLGNLRGEGISGRVFHVRRDTANVLLEPAVIKIQMLTLKHEATDETFMNEVRALLAVGGHPNVAAMIEYSHEIGQRGAIVMRECAGPPVYTRLQTGRVPLATLWRWAGQLMAALEFCHARRVMHGDIKPMNMMLTTTNDASSGLVLVDFGLAHRFDSADAAAAGLEYSSPVTTPWYRAPEVIVHGACSPCLGLMRPRFGFPIDMWAAGCVLYEFVYAATDLGYRSLFPGNTDAELANLILNELGSPTLAAWPLGSIYYAQLDPSREPVVNRRLVLSAPSQIPEVAALVAAVRPLLERLILWNPDRRLTAEAAHQIISSINVS